MPDAVRPRVGRTEIVRSLKTYSITRARSRAVLYAARVMEAMTVISAGSFSPEDSKRAIEHCFRDLISDAEAHGGFVPQTHFADIEIAEQRGLSQERIADLRDQITRSDFDGTVQQRAEHLFPKGGGHMQSLPIPRQLDLLNGVARALVEQQLLFRLRMDDRLAPYAPADPLFEGVSAAAAKPVLLANEASETGPTLAYAISEYLNYGRTRWTAKTLNGKIVQLGYLEEYLGPETLLGSITAQDVRNFRNAVSTLRANHGRAVAQSFKAKQTGNEKHRIAPKTASLIYGPTRTFFGWATEMDGMITENPAQNVRFAPEKKLKGSKPRRPFNAGELARIFCAPVFTGCRSRTCRFVPGPHIIRDGKYWLPILGLYTGARLGELVQLQIGDIVLDGPIPYISINEEDLGGVGEKKHVKSHAGIRDVPLHPDLIALGLLEHIRGLLKRKKKPSDRLFPEVTYGKDGQASTTASKYFGRFLNSIGLTSRTTVFHSFRHGAVDGLREAKIHQYVIDRIIGHSAQNVSASYGNGASLEVMYDAINCMKLNVSVPTVIEQFHQSIENIEQ